MNSSSDSWLEKNPEPMQLSRTQVLRPLTQRRSGNGSIPYLFIYIVFIVVMAVFLLCFWPGPFAQYAAPLYRAMDYLSENTRRVVHFSWWRIILLLAPALLFDTSRYYLPNIVISFVELFRSFRKRGPHPYEDPAQCPFVSVVIPAYNEGENIRNTIRSMLENNYPHFEVIVVDDCSSDGTGEICRQYASEGRIIYLHKVQRGGKPAALNYGLCFARGEIVIHFDSDSVIRRDTILEAVKPFVDPKIGAVAGNLKVLNAGDSLVATFQASEYGVGIDLQRRWLALTDTLQIASGAFGCFRKHLLVELMGTDPEVGEDSDITLKIRKRGYKVAFTPKAQLFTEVPDTWKALFRQRMLWDRCYIRVNLRKHGNIANLREFRFGDFAAVVLDLIFNLGLLALFPIYLAIVIIFVPELLLFILVVTYLYYTVMNIVQSVLVAVSSGDAWRQLILVCYAPFYFFYSCFLRGVRTFAYGLEIFRSKWFRKGYFPDKIWKTMPRY